MNLLPVMAIRRLVVRRVIKEDDMTVRPIGLREVAGILQPDAFSQGRDPLEGGPADVKPVQVDFHDACRRAGARALRRR